jgi:hypothetical protein
MAYHTVHLLDIKLIQDANNVFQQVWHDIQARILWLVRLSKALQVRCNHSVTCLYEDWYLRSDRSR